MNPRRMSTYLRRLTEWVVEPVRVVDEARVDLDSDGEEEGS